MSAAVDRPPMLDAESCARALASRDPRFDGVFFVGISTTRIYCRPVCPARVAYPDHRRFFPSAAAAERDGFRPCLRCRPELAPGLALVDAVPRVARAAALRIAAGALNGQGVVQLAQELGVGERQLRRAMERELGVSPLELAQTHRLLLAKCLLTDTALPVTRVAFASGFQSLRRFNTAFHERYRMSPSRLRRHARTPARSEVPGAPVGDLVRLTLSYRAPLGWGSLLADLAIDGLPGVVAVEGRRYGRTVALAGCKGVVLVEDAARGASPTAHLDVQVSASLLPVLMPLLARLRHLLDLDAEPAVIDAHLGQSGLSAAVRDHPGLRLPGAFDGFEIAVREILGSSRLAKRLVEALGQPIRSVSPSFTRLAPTADRVAAAGPSFLSALGVPRRRAEPLAQVARAVAGGTLRLEPGADVPSTVQTLRDIPGVGERTATTIVMRALHWPDAFPATDALLQRAAGADGSRALLRTAERWRPWRAYAAGHLRLSATRTAIHQNS
jgi:AraC family transcriptional regulator of adaptative response / DNA-3-methyladenine glycosylase II